jgi:excisionase family DNA binding protein
MQQTKQGDRRASFMRVSVLARDLDVSVQQVYLMLRSGEIQGVRFGRSWRIPTSVLEQLIEKAKANASDHASAPAATVSEQQSAEEASAR